jgi:hypothetical protein
LDLAAADLGADAADTAHAINPNGSTAGRNALADDLTQTRGMTATPAFVARSMLTIARMPSTSEDDDKWCGQLIALLGEQYDAGRAESGAPELLAALEAIRDRTFVDAEGPELRAQNECNHRLACAAIAMATGMADPEKEVAELREAVRVLGEYAARRLEGNKQHIRNAKRGTGVLSDWQRRTAKAKDALEANPIANAAIKNAGGGQ